MIIKIEGFKEVLDILKSMASGLKDVARLPEQNKKEMREALADTAELIDETLGIVKQQLSAILAELKYGDKQKAKQMIDELGDFQEWQSRYRQFQLCDKLTTATLNLERKGFYRLLHQITFKNPEEIKSRMWDFVGNETSAANSVSAMLKNLAKLDQTVDREETEVIEELETSRNEIGRWRQSFIDVEKEIRNSLG